VVQTEAVVATPVAPAGVSVVELVLLQLLKGRHLSFSRIISVSAPNKLRVKSTFTRLSSVPSAQVWITEWRLLEASKKI